MPDSKASPTSHSYISQRLRLHYLDWGNEQAENLMLVHGNRDHCHNWDWVAEALRDDYHLVAPDFRGHGDSAWVMGSAYSHSEYIYDLAQLIHQREMTPLKMLAHSLGGSVALRYAGIYPEHVQKLVVIEGTGGPPAMWQQEPPHERLRNWIEASREVAGRLPKRYPSLDAAYQRMHEANSYLRQDQARHLTIHGSSQNEDGSYSWKFDNYTHLMSPFDMTRDQVIELWGRIECPVLLVCGSDSWAYRPDEDLTGCFQNARQVVIEGAGHWVHHDKLQEFLQLVRDFLQE